MRITDRRNKPEKTYMSGEDRAIVTSIVVVASIVFGFWGYTIHNGGINERRDDRYEAEYEERRLDLCERDPNGPASCLLTLEQIEECREQSTPSEEKTCLAELASAQARMEG